MPQPQPEPKADVAKPPPEPNPDNPPSWAYIQQNVIGNAIAWRTHGSFTHRQVMYVRGDIANADRRRADALSGEVKRLTTQARVDYERVRDAYADVAKSERRAEELEERIDAVITLNYRTRMPADVRVILVALASHRNASESERTRLRGWLHDLDEAEKGGAK